MTRVQYFNYGFFNLFHHDYSKLYTSLHIGYGSILQCPLVLLLLIVLVQSLMITAAGLNIYHIQEKYGTFTTNY